MIKLEDSLVNASYFDEISSKKVVFFSGKGGVGKSALASASALLCHKKGKKVFLVSWNPFDYQARPLPYSQLGIHHLVVNGPDCFKEYAKGILKIEKLVNIIFDSKLMNTFTSAAPGLSEAVIAGKIWDVSDKNPDSIVIVDLPASGHAFSFFSSPIGLKKLFKMGLVHREIERICGMYFSPTTSVQFVTLPEEMPISETLEFRKKLSLQGGFHFAPILINQTLPQLPGQAPLAESLAQLGKKERELFTLFETLQQQEEEAVSALKNNQLEYRKIPRLSCPEWLTTIEAISEELAKL